MIALIAPVVACRRSANAECRLTKKAPARASRTSVFIVAPATMNATAVAKTRRKKQSKFFKWQKFKTN